MAAVGCAWSKTPLLPHPPALLTHQPVYPILAAALAGLAERRAQAWAAVGAAALSKDWLHRRDQLSIALPARPLVLLLVCQEPTAADLQRLAQLRI